MSIAIILASFGGGVIGALWGALPSFIFTGVLALAGIAVSAAGGPADMVGLAFGPMFGPHIGFAGGVAAAAFAGKMKDLDSGTDITAPLAKFGKPLTILIGGLFGILGALILWVFGLIGLATLTHFDNIALTVAVSGIISRLVFGKSGIIGKTGDGRKLMPEGKVIGFEAFAGIGLGLIAAYVAITTGQTSLPFALSAMSLVFAECGVPVPATHHITNSAAVAAVAAAAVFGLLPGLMFGLAFGVLGAVLGAIYGSIFNSACDTHIDPPAMTIATCTLITALIFMVVK